MYSRFKTCCASKMVFLILPFLLNSTFIGLFSRKGPNKDSTAERQMMTFTILSCTVLKCTYVFRYPSLGSEEQAEITCEYG